MWKRTWVDTLQYQWVQFSSVPQLCLILCKPLDAECQASLSITNSQSLPKLISTELVMPSNDLILCHPFSSCPQFSSASGSFQMSQFFTSGGQSIGVSASTSVLPMNTQDWSISFWMDWLDLLAVQGTLSLLQYHSWEPHEQYENKISVNKRTSASVIHHCNGELQQWWEYHFRWLMRRSQWRKIEQKDTRELCVWHTLERLKNILKWENWRNLIFYLMQIGKYFYEISLVTFNVTQFIPIHEKIVDHINNYNCTHYIIKALPSLVTFNLDKISNVHSIMGITPFCHLIFWAWIHSVFLLHFHIYKYDHTGLKLCY